MKEAYGICESYIKRLEGKANKEFANKRLKCETIIYELYDGYKGGDIAKTEIQEYDADGQLVLKSLYEGERLFYENHYEYNNGKIVKTTDFMLNEKGEKVVITTRDIRYSDDSNTVHITHDNRKKGEIRDFIMTINKDAITVTTVEDGESKVVLQQLLDENGEVIKYVDTQYEKVLTISDVE